MMRTSDCARRGSSRAASTRARRASARGVAGSACPSASSSATPSAASAPLPPSLVLLPPSPIMKRRTPRSSSAATSSPTPRVERSATGVAIARASVMPTTCATSMTAVGPSGVAMTPYAARTGAPSAPGTSRSRRCPFAPTAASTASSVPSPPSAIGRAWTCASGTARAIPRASAAQTSGAASEPLNESGARTMRSMGAWEGDGGACGPPVSRGRRRRPGSRGRGGRAPLASARRRARPRRR